MHQKCFNVNSSGHKEPQNCIFNHLMLVDANCDDSVTIPRCPNLVVDLKVSVALKKIFACLRAHFGHPPISNPGSTPATCINVITWLQVSLVPLNFACGGPGVRKHITLG